MKKVRMILAAIAFVFAIVGAFATSFAPLENKRPVGFDQNQTLCDQTGTCDIDVTTELCETVAQQDVYEIIAGNCSASPLVAGRYAE